MAVLQNVERVVREEMNAIGSQEVHFPALIPREIFEASGRWSDYGDLLFRLHDRKGADYLLAPTHEELFTLLVKGEYSSYKDYPLALYQIQIKYRDEARPRAGILRGREFIMKDSYSFDLSHEGLEKSYRAHRDAYERIFTRLGLTYKIVFAVSGAMGGSASEEFLAPAPSGEDTFVQCTNCDYAANTEAVEIAAPEPADPADHAAQEVLDTPDTPTIDTLVARMNELGHPTTAADTLKNVVLRTQAPGRGGLAAARRRRARATARSTSSGSAGSSSRSSSSRPAPTTSPSTRALVKGYIGPQILADWKVRYLVDPLVVEGSGVGDRRERAGQARRARRARARLHAGRRDRRRRDPRRRPLRALRRPARDRPRHRARPRVPARHEVRRDVRADRARPERQAGDRDDGLLRRRRDPRRGGARRADLRREGPVLAASGRPGRRPHRRDRQGRHGVRRRGLDRRPSSTPPASG